MLEIKGKKGLIKLTRTGLTLLLSGATVLTLSGFKSANKQVKEVGLSYSYSLKSLKFSEPERENLEEKSGIDKLTITYRDTNSLNFISGIDLVVKDYDGNIVDEFTTNEDEHTIKGLKPNHNYYIEELNTPREYSANNNIIKVNLTPYTNTTLKDEINEEEYYIKSCLNLYNEKIKDKIAKKNGTFSYGEFGVKAQSLKEGSLEGVEFEVTNSNNELIDTWKSTRFTHTITNLTDGNYTLKVKTIPENYEVNVSDNFYTKKEYDVNIHYGEYNDESGNFLGNVVLYFDKLEKENIKTTNRITSIDNLTPREKEQIVTDNNGNQIIGAIAVVDEESNNLIRKIRVVIKDSNNKIVDEFITNDSMTIIYGLKLDEEYSIQLTNYTNDLNNINNLTNKIYNFKLSSPQEKLSKNEVYRNNITIPLTTKELEQAINTSKQKTLTKNK